MTEQQVTGSVDEAQIPTVPEQGEPQGEAPARLPAQPDPVAAAAVDLAREAAQEVAQPGTVGRHLSVSREASGLTLHAFDCTAKGYRGWRWAVTLAHLPGSDRVTVCDTVLLPGAESIMAPDWVPWSDRLAPGDLGAGDELPFKQDDPNLVPGYTVTDEDDADQQLFWELGLGRERVLGPEGVSAAADRWHRGEHGPTADTAVQASSSCVTCAYFVPLSGIMRQHFGACANEWSPADGSVVTADFGCGAHSETDLEMPAPEPLSDHILDETVVDRMDLAAAESVPGIETGTASAEADLRVAGPSTTDPGSEAAMYETLVAVPVVAEAETDIDPQNSSEDVVAVVPLDPGADHTDQTTVDPEGAGLPEETGLCEDTGLPEEIAPVAETGTDDPVEGAELIRVDLADTVRQDDPVLQGAAETDPAEPVALAADSVPAAGTAETSAPPEAADEADRVVQPTIEVARGESGPGAVGMADDGQTPVEPSVPAEGEPDAAEPTVVEAEPTVVEAEPTVVEVESAVAEAGSTAADDESSPEAEPAAGTQVPPQP